MGNLRRLCGSALGEPGSEGGADRAAEMPRMDGMRPATISSLRHHRVRVQTPQTQTSAPREAAAPRSTLSSEPGESAKGKCAGRGG